MVRTVARIPVSFGGGLLFLALTAVAANAQTRPPTFEVEAGPQYGAQDTERAVTPGWTVSSSFDIGGQTFVAETSWYRNTFVQEYPAGIWGVWTVDDLGDAELLDFGADVVRQTERTRYWTAMAGVRGGERSGRVSPYYQILVGGFATRFRRDYEWPERLDTEAANAACGVYTNGELVHPCDYPLYPEFDEERFAGFVMQPGMGIDVNVWRRFGLRVAADLPILASRDYVVLRPRLSARVVVALKP